MKQIDILDLLHSRSRYIDMYRICVCRRCLKSRLNLIVYLNYIFFDSLKYINVAMVTVLKNVTNVITAVGEMYLFNKQHDNRVWAALFLMVCLSALKVFLTDSVNCT